MVFVTDASVVTDFVGVCEIYCNLERGPSLRFRVTAEEAAGVTMLSCCPFISLTASNRATLPTLAGLSSWLG